MAYFLTDEEKNNALFHIGVASRWLEAMKKECEQNVTSTAYLKEKARMVKYAVEAVECSLEIVDKQKSWEVEA